MSANNDENIYLEADFYETSLLADCLDFNHYKLPSHDKKSDFPEIYPKHAARYAQKHGVQDPASLNSYASQAEDHVQSQLLSSLILHQHQNTAGGKQKFLRSTT